MTTLLYGSVIKLVSTEQIYDNKFFFVERLDDNELVLNTQTDDKIILPVVNNSLGETIKEIIVIYKPTTNFAQQNRLYVKHWVEIELDDITVKGQIISIDKYIEVKLKDTTIYLPIDRGLPKGVKKFTTITKPLNLEYKTIPEKVEEQADEIENNVILGFIEEDVDVGVPQYFYSIEQQTTDLLEHLIMYIPEEARTPTAIKKMSKTIQRYKEIRSKYTEFSDGIYINKLPTDQILQSILELKNKLFLPISKDIQVFYFTRDVDVPVTYFTDDENADQRDFFYKKSPFWENKPIRKLENENISFQEKMTVMGEITNNSMVYKKVNDRKTKHTPTVIDEVILYDKETILTSDKRYIIRVDEPYIIHSFMTPPIDYIKYLKTKQNSSNIIDKANMMKMPFYSMFYKSLQNNIKNIKASNIFIYSDKYVYYENQTELFETYANKIMPSLDGYIEMGFENQFIKPFYNFHQGIKNLENVNISELTNADFVSLKAFINIGVKRYIKNMMTEKLPILPVSLFKPNIALGHILELYQNIMPKSIQEQYYSASEILKFSEIDNTLYYCKDYIKVAPISNITDDEIREVQEELMSMLDIKDVKETIQRVYKTEQERENESVFPVILQDIDRINGLEHIYKRLIQDKVKGISLEKLKVIVDDIIKNSMKPLPKMNTELANKIILYINEIKVVNGNTAYVEESKKTYKRIDDKWVSTEDPQCFDKKKLVSVKGTCDVVEKESEYTKRVKILLDGIVQRKETEKAVNASMNDITAEKYSKLLVSLNNKNLQRDLKYNNQRDRYGIIETQKDNEGTIESPYAYIRDRILIEPNLEFKYKAIQKFISKFTKRGIDNYWYYCIETSAKLLPSFFHKLADAYLIKKNYNAVIEEICLEQGTLSDNGDKWVDKNSGYIIKEIVFDEEDGFMAREVIIDTDKEIFSEAIVEELAVERYVKTAIKTLFFYLGVYYIEENNLYNIILNTFTLSTASFTDETKKKSIMLISIISNVFVFIQSYPGNLKLTPAFPNCKRSFSGYPLSLDETLNEGLKYMACVVKGISKSAPWSQFNKITEPELINYLKQYIKKFVITNFDVEIALIKKRENPDIVAPHHIQTVWNNFLPRLKPIKETIVREQRLESITDYRDRIYYLSALVQKEIHIHVAAQELILTDHLSNPYLVNACCNEDNYTYRYFLKNSNIMPSLKEILLLKRPLRKMERLLLNQKMYFNENTQKMISKPSSTLSDETIYSGLIKWSTTHPDIFERFKFPVPKYNKYDTLQTKINKMQNQGILVTENTFINMIQYVAERIVKEAPKEPEPYMDDPIVQLLDTPDKLANYLDERNKSFISKLKKYDNSEDFISVINFNNTALNNKNNLVISKETEHYSHMNQLLYNKINLLLYTFPEMVYSKKNGLHTVYQKHWDLSPIHAKDVTDTVNTYYNNIYQITQNEDIGKSLIKVEMERYINLMKIKLENQELQNLLYQHIFLGILYEYKTFKLTKEEKSNINIYLNTVIKIFERENRLALNYDTTRIKYEINLSKKSETQIKTDYFKSLSKDARKAEGVLKEHKLEKWGVGLQKGMFQYVKANYLKDKLDAKAILDNITGDVPEKLDIYEPTMPSQFDSLDDPNEDASNLDEEDEIDEDDY
jgi:hypothetical protein